MMNIILARVLRRKVVITAHDVESFASKLSVPIFVRLAYHMANQIIAHNRVSKEELTEAIGISGEKISIIPHGNYFHAIGRIPGQSDARLRLGLPQDAKVLLFFGHIKEVKGLDLLLQALPGVLRAYPDVLLLIAGKAWKIDFSRYQEMIEELGIGDRCLVHGGFIPPDKAPFYFSAADLVVLPYRRIYQSGVLLMALSYGKAVLASDLEGMKEVITDGETGYLFSSGDANSLRDRLIEVLADPIGLRLVAERSQHRIREDRDWEIIGKKTADCYRALLART
jgi:glycosyltransferase involved in cell wall biosynthesis